MTTTSNQKTKETFKVSKLSMRLSRDGYVSYNCEIRKGRKTYAFVDQEGIGGSEHILSLIHI